MTATESMRALTSSTIVPVIASRQSIWRSGQPYDRAPKERAATGRERAEGGGDERGVDEEAEGTARIQSSTLLPSLPAAVPPSPSS